MKLAVNYSPQAAALLAEGRIAVDLFKLPDLPAYLEAARARCATYVHFGMRAGRGRVDAAVLDRAAELLEATDTEWVNAHLMPCQDDYPGMDLRTRTPADAQRLRASMLRDIAPLTDRFGAGRVALENGIWAPTPPYLPPAAALEAGFIADLILCSGTRMVLDLAHADVSARWLGMGVHDYLGQLPLDRVVELHVSGTERGADGEWRDHAPMAAHDWELVEWAMAEIRRGRLARPGIVALEYGGVGPGFDHLADPEVLQRDLTRLAGLVRG